MSLITETRDADEALEDFERAVLDGLSDSPKHIPCRFLYDARGSELFEEITRLDEYYPTRTEIGLLEHHGPEIAALAGEGCAVVEFGSGSSRKTHILLEHMEKACAYVPIDIDDAALEEAAGRMRAAFPQLPLYPVHADFNEQVNLPDEISDAPRLGFFPGSTIGNFEPDAARNFMARAGQLLGANAEFLIGVDLDKDPDILVPAYDDSSGVTAEFTLNLLSRIKRELGADLNPEFFEHQAEYNRDKGRIEIYLVSQQDQSFQIAGRKILLGRGERIHVENSHKYTLDGFNELAQDAGWNTERAWSDPDRLFSIHYLRRS